MIDYAQKPHGTASQNNMIHPPPGWFNYAKPIGVNQYQVAGAQSPCWDYLREPQ